MKTAQDIIEGVLGLLEAEEPKRLKERRRRIRRLATERARMSASASMPRRRRGIVFTTDQARMSRASSKLVLKVLALGVHIGDLELSTSSSPVFTAKSDVCRRYGILPAKARLAWSHSSAHAREIDSFLGECIDKLPSTQPELQIQLQLADALGSRKESIPALANLALVKPFGFFTEIPTVVTRDQSMGTGNIDILARTGRGRNSHFVALELKQPNAKDGEIAAAFRQAIGYAAALSFEANGLSDRDASGCLAEYHRLFKSTARAMPSSSYDGSPLRAHAAIVVPASRERAVKKAFSELAVEAHPPSVLGHRMRVGALLYEATRDRNTWTLDRSSLRWLDDEAAWSPVRNLR